MYKRGLILRFPPEIVTEPVVCNLAKKYDITFNILKATITPGKEGIMVLELEGTQTSLKKGLEYLKKVGVQVVPLEQKVVKNEEKCIHCGVCTAVCPTGALYIERPSFEVKFDPQKCSACEYCISVCTTKAMEISIKNGEEIKIGGF